MKMTQKTEVNTGGVIFPSYDVSEGDDVMTLRDWFAGQALAALISKAPFFDRDGEFGRAPTDMVQFKLDMAASAYGYADAMIAERGA